MCKEITIVGFLFVCFFAACFCFCFAFVYSDLSCILLKKKEDIIDYVCVVNKIYIPPPFFEFNVACASRAGRMSVCSSYT